MGIMDKANEMKNKAAEALKDDENVDKVAQKADEMTDGKYSDQIDKGSETLKDKLGNDKS